MFVAFVSVGARSAFGVFVVPMEQDFEWSRGVISVAAALGLLVNGLTLPLLGGLLGLLILAISGATVVFYLLQRRRGGPDCSGLQR